MQAKTPYFVDVVAQGISIGTKYRLIRENGNLRVQEFDGSRWTYENDHVNDASVQMLFSKLVERNAELYDFRSKIYEIFDNPSFNETAIIEGIKIIKQDYDELKVLLNSCLDDLCPNTCEECFGKKIL